MPDRDNQNDPGTMAYWFKGVAEGKAFFEPEPIAPPSLETVVDLYRSVLVAYDYTCAMTGKHYPPGAALPHDRLEVVAIRPLAERGTFHVSNFICLDAPVAQAFVQGSITAGNDGELVVDLSRLPAEVLDTLNVSGRLRLPHTDVAQPDPLALAFHARHIFRALR